MTEIADVAINQIAPHENNRRYGGFDDARLEELADIQSAGESEDYASRCIKRCARFRSREYGDSRSMSMRQWRSKRETRCKCSATRLSSISRGSHENAASVPKRRSIERLIVVDQY